MRRLGALVVLAFLALAAPAASRDAPRAHVTHVAIVVLENTEYGDVIGSRDAPYLNGLARRYALATHYYAIRHPSLPNYLALLGGSTFGIDSDCDSCHVPATNLVDQLEQAGKTWRAYMEGAPSACFGAARAGEYTRHHDPFLYFDDVAANPTRCANVVPLTELAADIRAGTLPAFVWITPDECHDMHDCRVRDGDRFLASLVPPLLRALGPRGVLFVTWDEGTSDRGCCRLASGGHVATIAAGALARRGVRSAVPYDHYSLLRTIEDIWRLPRLRAAGCTCTRSLAALLRSR